MKSKVEDILSKFNPISLEEIDNVALLNRIDTKYVCNSNLLEDFLTNLEKHYYVLQIKDKRCFRYETMYFDTPKSDMFISHIRGKLNRYKVRKRVYADTGDSFLEIKFKNNKKRTVKTRTIEHLLNSEINGRSDFLSENIPYSPDSLNPILESFFCRVTFVDHNLTHRVTMDFDLRFRNHDSHDNKDYNLPHLAIIEIKSSRSNRGNKIHDKLREFGIQPYGFSKYCMGRALTDPDFEKISLLKPKLLHLNKIADVNIYNCG